MKKKTIIWLSAFFLLFIINLLVILGYVHKVRRVHAATNVLDEIDADYHFEETEYRSEGARVEVKSGDARVANLKRFFRKHNSPLYDSAETVVKVSDIYAFDYRLLPAIAMQESGLCRAIPDNSYNCWGWGIYGNTVTRFDSYDDAIDSVARGLRKNYLDKGLVTASQIMEKYTPSSNGSWARGVNTFIEALE